MPVWSRGTAGTRRLRAERSRSGIDTPPKGTEGPASARGGSGMERGAATAGRAGGIGAVPGDIVEGGVRSGLAFDRFECGADAGAQRFEPGAGGGLFGVEGQHGGLVASAGREVERWSSRRIAGKPSPWADSRVNPCFAGCA